MSRAFTPKRIRVLKKMEAKTKLSLARVLIGDIK